MYVRLRYFAQEVPFLGGDGSVLPGDGAGCLLDAYVLREEKV